MSVQPITLDIFRDCDQLKIRALVFQSPYNTKHAYVYCDVNPQGGLSDYEYRETICKKYQLDDIKMLSGFNSGSACENKAFWMLYQEDCFDPSCFVIMGESELGSDIIDDAVDSFVGLQYSWDDIERDYTESTDTHGDQRTERINKAVNDGIIGVADGGLYYHSEILRAVEVKLIGIELM